MRNGLIVICLVGLGILTSCEKEIDIDLNSSNPQLIIEANINDDLGPYEVRLSRSLNFSDTQNFPSEESALVIITDLAGVVDTLTHIGGGRYLTSDIQGISGHTYKLEVQLGNDVFSAKTTMPEKILMDSLRFERVEGFVFTSGVRYLAVPVFTDPVALGNSYRHIQTVNGEMDRSYAVSNDNIGNGDINERPIRSFDVEIVEGDVVELEMRCISTEIYNYFFTLSQIESNGPGGGTTPTNPPSNIIGDNCQGYFSAHTVQRITKIVTE